MGGKLLPFPTNNHHQSTIKPHQMRLICFVLCCLLVSVLTRAQIYMKFQYDADSTYRAVIPGHWELENTKNGAVQWQLVAPTRSRAAFLPTIQFEQTLINAAFKDADLRKFNEEELRITKQQGGDAISIQETKYIYINNKEWVRYVMELRQTKKKGIKFLVQKTIHNGKAHGLVFSSKMDLFDQYKDSVLWFFNEFRFNDSDTVNYASAKKVSESDVKAFLGKYEGVYLSALGNIKQTIFVQRDSRSGYILKELRELTLADKSVHSFEATLAIEEINNEQIVLATDAILRESPDFNWMKGVYRLKNPGQSLQGSFFSKNNAFDDYDLNLTRLAQPATGSTSKVKGADTQKAPAPPAEENSVDPGQRTYSEPGTESEAASIQKYGKGKVTRVNKNEIKFILTSGKSISIKNKYNPSLKVYDHMGEYIGYDNITNSYLLLVEDGAVNLVNRNSGLVSSESILNFWSAVFSPDKKWMFINNVYEDGGAELKMYSIGSSVKRAFAKYTYDAEAGKGWESGEVQWLDNQTIEIEKQQYNPDDDSFKKLGKTWLSNQNGKWLLMNTRPRIQPVDNSSSARLVEGYSPPNTDEVLPYVKPRTLLGGKTPDELGRILLTCIKNNDAKTWYSCTLEGDLETAQKDILEIRNELEMNGLTNWGLVNFSRVKYSECCFGGKPNDSTKFESYKIEFKYGSEFIGLVQGYLNSARISRVKGKFVLNKSINAAFLFRKEEYR